MATFLSNVGACSSLLLLANDSADGKCWTLQKTLTTLTKEVTMVELASIQMSSLLLTKVLPYMREHLLDIVDMVEKKMSSVLRPSLLWVDASHGLFQEIFQDLAQYANALFGFLENSWDHILRIRTDDNEDNGILLAEIRAVLYRLHTRWAWNTKQFAACVQWVAAPQSLAAAGGWALTFEKLLEKSIKSLDERFFAAKRPPQQPVMPPVEYFVGDPGMPGVPANHFALGQNGILLVGRRDLVLYAAGEGSADLVVALQYETAADDDDLLKLCNPSRHDAPADGIATHVSETLPPGDSVRKFRGRTLGGRTITVPFEKLRRVAHPCEKAYEDGLVVSRSGVSMHVTQNVCRETLVSRLVAAASRDSVRTLGFFGPNAFADFHSKYGYRLIHEWSTEVRRYDFFLIGWVSQADGKMYIGGMAKAAETHDSWLSYLSSTRLSPPVSRDYITINSCVPGAATLPALRLFVPEFVAYVCPPLVCDIAEAMRTLDLSPAPSVVESLRKHLVCPQSDVRGFGPCDVPLQCILSSV